MLHYIITVYIHNIVCSKLFLNDWYQCWHEGVSEMCILMSSVKSSLYWDHPKTFGHFNILWVLIFGISEQKINGLCRDSLCRIDCNPTQWNMHTNVYIKCLVYVAIFFFLWKLLIFFHRKIGNKITWVLAKVHKMWVSCLKETPAIIKMALSADISRALSVIIELYKMAIKFFSKEVYRDEGRRVTRRIHWPRIVEGSLYTVVLKRYYKLCAACAKIGKLGFSPGELSQHKM